jgi:O-antigen/teichoic acid export membrane protein
MSLNNNIENLPGLPQRVAKNSAVVLFGQAFSLMANLGTTVLMARYLGKDGFGLFSYAIIFVSFFALLADFGMQAILIREFSRNQWRAEEILGNAVLIKVVLSITASALIILAAWVIGSSALFFRIIAILAINVLVSSKLLTLRSVFDAPFNASLRMEVPILSQLLDGLLLVGITYGLIQAGVKLEVLVIGYTLSNLPGLFLIIFAAVRRFSLRFAANHELMLFLLRESLPLLLYSVLMTLFNGVDVLLLKTFQGESGVGLYSAALRLTSPLIFIPQVVVASLLPLLSRYHEQTAEKLTKAFHLGMKVTLLVALTLAIAATAWGTEVIRLLYSVSTALLMMFLLFSCGARFFSSGFLFCQCPHLGQPANHFYATAAMLIVNSVANLLMIPKFGIQGAATQSSSHRCAAVRFCLLLRAKFLQSASSNLPDGSLFSAFYLLLG